MTWEEAKKEAKRLQDQDETAFCPYINDICRKDCRWYQEPWIKDAVNSELYTFSKSSCGLEKK